MLFWRSYKQMRKADRNAESLYNSWTAGPISLIFVANEAQSNSARRLRASVVNLIPDAEISAIFPFLLAFLLNLQLAFSATRNWLHWLLTVLRNLIALRLRQKLVTSDQPFRSYGDFQHFGQLCAFACNSVKTALFSFFLSPYQGPNTFLLISHQK